MHVCVWKHPCYCTRQCNRLCHNSVVLTLLLIFPVWSLLDPVVRKGLELIMSCIHVLFILHKFVFILQEVRSVY